VAVEGAEAASGALGQDDAGNVPLASSSATAGAIARVNAKIAVAVELAVPNDGADMDVEGPAAANAEVAEAEEHAAPNDRAADAVHTTDEHAVTALAADTRADTGSSASPEAGDGAGAGTVALHGGPGSSYGAKEGRAPATGGSRGSPGSGRAAGAAHAALVAAAQAAAAAAKAAATADRAAAAGPKVAVAAPVLEPAAAGAGLVGAATRTARVVTIHFFFFAKSFGFIGYS
jgi:hypothetical protein